MREYVDVDRKHVGEVVRGRRGNGGLSARREATAGRTPPGRGAALAPPCSRPPETDAETTLRRFLQAYWLRPENAMWMTLRSLTLSSVPLEPPMIDACCGDGLFSFLHAGGVLNEEFDVFADVGSLDDVKAKHADMFDQFTESYAPAIESRAAAGIDVGLDAKAALLAKAEKLEFYGRTLRHDCSLPLPFDDGSFQTTYCNAAYWIAHIDEFLRELARVTRPGGRVILHVKLDSMKRYTLERHREVLGRRLLEIIGRGRVESWPTLADRHTWDARFASAALDVVSATPFITSTHAHVWDIGLRPIAPMLVKMANALTPRTRASIKREWVELFCELLGPLCRPDLQLFDSADEPAEIQYVLSPL